MTGSGHGGITVAMPTWMGDCVMATPALRAIQSARPAVGVTLAVSRAFAPLFDGLGFQTTDPLSRSFMGALRARQPRSAGLEVLLLPNSLGSAMRARAAWPGASIVGWGSPLRNLVLNTSITQVHRTGSIPTVDHYACLIEGWLSTTVADLRVRLVATQGDRDAAQAALGAAAPSVPRLAILNPGASKPSKRWPAERFAAVGRHLVGLGFVVCVSGSPAEQGLCGLIASEVPSAIDLSGSGAGIRALKGLLARASLLVTNDTGTRHVAAALGCPYICIYGPVDPMVSKLEGVDGTDLVPHDGRCSSIGLAQVIDAIDRCFGARGLS